MSQLGRDGWESERDAWEYEMATAPDSRDEYEVWADSHDENVILLAQGFRPFEESLEEFLERTGQVPVRDTEATLPRPRATSKG